MKRLFAIILALTTLLSLCACGNSGNTNTTQTPAGTTIGDETPPENISTSDNATDDKTIPEDDSTSDNSIGATVGDVIDFDLDFDFNVDPVDNVQFSIEDYIVPDFDFDFSVEPVQITTDLISFEVANYEFTIDPSVFDAEQFALEAAENFSDEDQEKLTKMDVRNIINVAEKRANLLADLSHAYKTSGLDVVVDVELGEIILDSSVLFDVDKSEISAEGKEFLKKFIIVYTTIVHKPKYEDFLARVYVEGHTDSTGDYDHNLSLSQSRAENVMAFCLSDECCPEEYSAKMKRSLEAIGYSCDRLIYDENGNEDKEASRRVSFRFIIDLP